MIDMKTIHSAHFIGITGVAMTALAVYMKERGVHVTGSDVPGDFPTVPILEQAGIAWETGFDPTHIGTKNKPDIVIYTGAHNGRENPEVIAAQDRGIPVLPHGEALGMIMDATTQISVAGSHGKTTTSAMIATILTEGRFDPSYAIGCGEIIGLGSPGHYGGSTLFVAEADEYITDPNHDRTPRFLWQHPDTLVVTNIDFDHPDAYTDLDAVKQAFLSLQSQERGKKLTIVNGDDPESRILTKTGTSVMTYGYSPNADVHITHVGFGDERTFFSLSVNGIDVGDFTLKVAGKHNVSNAAAAAAACVAAGMSWEEIKKGLLVFGGTKRRFEKIGKVGDITVYDDYAHHPHEIQATIAAAREWYPNHRIITVFQPHTYSRTKALLAEFSESFAGSDIALFTDIYASAREYDSLGMTNATLPERVAKTHPHAVYTKDCGQTIQYIVNLVRPGDVIICMGAGDIYTWGKTIVQALHDKEHI